MGIGRRESRTTIHFDQWLPPPSIGDPTLAAAAPPPPPPHGPPPPNPPKRAQAGLIDWWERLLATILRGEASLAALAANLYSANKGLSTNAVLLGRLVAAVETNSGHVFCLATKVQREGDRAVERAAERTACCVCYVRGSWGKRPLPVVEEGEVFEDPDNAVKNQTARSGDELQLDDEDVRQRAHGEAPKNKRRLECYHKTMGKLLFLL